MSDSTRTLLTKLARASHGGLISVLNAAEALDMPRREAALKLAALTRRGWLSRARRGLYLVRPLEADPARPAVVEDPWVLARETFAPCYIGGWSAAEYWGLTEQLFRSILVVTAANVRTRSLRMSGHEFRLFHVPRSRISETTSVWRDSERVPVSDRERTIVDGLRHPELCGGIRHVIDIMHAYGESRERDFARLARVARKMESGAVWKRLGYLAERLWPDAALLHKEAKTYLTTGNVKLDPAMRRRGTLVRRWRLWVNMPIDHAAEES